MKKYHIPYGRQEINAQDIEAVVKALTDDFLTQGPRILQFEQAFAEYIGAKYAVAVANGTAALHLAALGLGVNENSKVITTPITFSASANCVRYCGGQVSFVDIDPETLLIDIKAVRKLLESSPKGTYTGIIPVDFAGYPVDLEALRALADEYNLWILEDACHAPGGYFIDSLGEKQYAGNGRYAEAAIFSFHPVKHIAAGEGGMITTNDIYLYEKLLKLRTHGITKNPQEMHENHGGWYMEMQTLGYNYRLTDFQAALGISQLQRADIGMERRQIIAKRYDEAFGNSPNIKIIRPAKNIFHAYHLYVIQVESRLELYDELKKAGIFAQVHYIPVYLMPYYQSLGYPKGLCPKAENYYQHCLSIPMYPSMTDEEQNYVIECIQKLVAAQ